MHAIESTSPSYSSSLNHVPKISEVIRRIKEAIKQMDEASVWKNYPNRDYYVKPDEKEVENAPLFLGIFSLTILAVKTNDGRFWHICSKDGDCSNFNEYFIQQHDEKGGTSVELADHYGRRDYDFPISYDDAVEIEGLIKSKLTLSK